MPRQLISSGTHWEASVGYSRAIRVGDLIEVSGTIAADANSQVVGVGDPYRQAQFIFEKIEKALQAAGGQMTDVIRTRMYVTDMNHWEAIAKAHGEVFQSIRPASTLVEVSGLVSAEYLVEIEVTALLGDE